MKKTLIFVLSIAAIFTLSNCNGLKKMIENADDINYSVNPKVLEMHGGEVAVSIKGNFPEKYFNKKVTATITPTLVYEGGEKALTPVYIQGEKIDGNATVINYKAGGAFSYTEKFDYIDDMRRSTLELRISAAKGNKTQDFEPETVAEGIIATPDLVKLIGAGSPAKDKFVKDIPDAKMGLVNYDKNRAELKHAERKRDEIVALKDYVNAVNEDDRKEFTGVELISYASPEGPIDINTKVSNDRSKTIDKFVKNEFRKIEDFKEDSFFKYLVTEEDWDGFKKAVSESDLADKDLILRVVNMNTDPVKREQEIRNMTQTFEELEKLIHPMLRRSEVLVNVMLIGNTDAEIDSLFNADPAKLSVEELLYLGAMAESADKKLAVYTKTTELYPKDWRGFNNLTCVLCKKGDLKAARTTIEKAKSLEANATVFNVLGNVYLAEGNIEEAKTSYQSATGVPAASIGQGVIAIKAGEYDKAANFFGNDCSFNAGLAKLMSGDNDGAIKAADCGTDKDDAHNFYLKAIAGARKGDTDVLFNNLRTACTKDASLKEFAAKDMEFFNYFDNDTFKTIIK
ncbi:MAG: hypothetical protein PHW82_08860 [Bacteroidales bacterium]|nr:hypothetical protein [Bacteroidales bacterium]